MSAGVLVAEEIHVEQESTVELEGTLAAAAVDAGAMTLTLNGVIVRVDARTIFRDRSSTPVTGLALADLAASMHIQVSAYPDSSSAPALAVATRVERLDPDPKVFITSPVSAKEAGQLTMLGVSVDTSAASFHQPNGTDYTDQAAFLAAITLNSTIVKVNGSSSGSTFSATEAEVED